MADKGLVAFGVVCEEIDRIESDRSISRAKYRDFLEQIQSTCQSRIDGLDSDDERDAAKSNGGEEA